MSAAPEWYERGLPHAWLPQGKSTAPLPVALAEGSRIVLADGRELVDGTASWGTACHGYNHPYLRGAIAQQLATLPHAMPQGLVQEQALTLAARLADILPSGLDRVVFSNSGHLAAELAMKMAAQYWLGRGAHGRNKILAFKGGTPGANTHVVAEQCILDLPRDEATAAALDEFLAAHVQQIAGILIEPLVQFAGGVVFHDEMCLARIRRAAGRHDLILIFDERFTGFARTGPLFACEAGEAAPDVIVLGDALSGGVLPLAATVATERIFDTSGFDNFVDTRPLESANTPNALACAAANASLDLFRDKSLCLRAAEIGKKLTYGLGPCVALPGVTDVRVCGAIGVVELEGIADLDAIRRQFAEAGVWIWPFRNVVSLTPALTIADGDLELLTNAVFRVLKTRGD